MKLKYTYIFFLAISAYVLLRSNTAGRTGQIPPMQNCASAGCHNTTPATGNTTIDSISLFDKTTGLAVTQYTAGTSYRIAIVGKYVGNVNLHKFGFIVNNGTKGTFSGTNSTSTTNVAGGIGYWGHSASKDSFLRIPLGPVSTTIFIDTCTWTAPGTGSGTVTFQGLLNAVNANGLASTDRPTAAVYTRNFAEYAANVNVAIGGGATFCAGTSKTFTATPNNGGATPTYQWYHNGTMVGTGGTTYTNAALANNDSVWCVMTSSIVGIGNNPATSNKVKVIVNPIYVNNVTIVCNKTNVCAGDTAIYTATPGVGATNPLTYRWYLNNTLVFNGNPYQKNGGFLAGDSVSCRLQVGNQCATPVQDTSNFIKLIVNASPVLTPIPPQTFCAGVASTKISFVSSLPNTTYTWTNSNPTIGLPASGTDDSIGSFIPINPGPGNLNANITVRSFGAGCNGTPITFTIQVRPSPRVRRPNVPTYCAGATGSLALVSVPAGGTIAWTNTNTAVGIPASGTGTPLNFTSTNTTTDSIQSFVSARATAGGCTGPDSTFRVVVYPVPVVTAVPNIIGCNGQPIADISFVSNITNSTFNWTNSNGTIGILSAGSGDITGFNATNTSNAPVVANLSVTARYMNCNSTPKNFTITVNNSSAPTVDIFSKDTMVCPGANSLFKATPTNGGPTPTYQWFKNGIPIFGADKDTAMILNLQDNDKIKCDMISNSSCVTTNTGTSREITIKTIANVTPQIILTSVKDTICQGQAVIINSSIDGGGVSPTYQWYLNGSAISGATSNLYLSNTFVMNDVITCEMTSSLGCASPPKVTSNEYRLKVFPLVATQISMVADKTKICSDDYVTFTATFKGGGIDPKVLWTLNGVEMNTNVKFITVPISNVTDVVKVVVKSSEVCPSPSSMIVSKSIDSVGQGPYVDVEPNKYISFCEGDSAKVRVFNGASNLTYQWSNGLTSDSFYSKLTNSFTLRVTQPGNKCPRYYGPLTTHMNALPTRPEITFGNGILRSSLADRYQWQLNKLDIIAADTQTYKIAIKGNYRVKVTNSAGCSSYSDILTVFPLSISVSKENKLEIYPNPSTGNFYIKSDDKKIESVSIYDLYGKLVYSNSTKEMTKHIQVENLPKGNYFIQINTSNNSYQEKIELR
jgi:hypothetical protein